MAEVHFPSAAANRPCSSARNLRRGILEVSHRTADSSAALALGEREVLSRARLSNGLYVQNRKQGN
jgi:hypothetical protein